MNVKQRFSQLNKNSSLDYFVVTDFSELTEQADLNDFLRSHFVILKENQDYLIFDLQSHLISEAQD